MIKSMTGYGKAEAVLNHKKITVEIRSLNSKQLDLTVKVPAVYRQSEYEIRNRIGKRLQRGKIDAYVSYEITGDSVPVNIDRKTFTAYFGQIREIAAENGIDWNGSALDAAVVPAVLRLPEVIQNDQQTVSEAETQALKRCVEEAVDHMEQFRIQEGTILIADLLRRIDRIEQLKEEIVPFEKARAETIKTRIRENIESLGIPFDANRLEQEMIYYIEKLDITEEKVRLQNHCKYFREVARGEEAPGRKLGFIAQELGREINTLGSKANEATIQKKVVEMKDELEKIKEQVLNIL
ncbi:MULTISPECIES: YicC/YloC family endoribonuclease [unclassified Alistipes]|uniref:YicC/YloC family endoribonuclease n=1 Tax=unclassified Alistipes TaxID=2608932 RepID=UPI001E4EFBA1|nr:MULTISPECIES: YicC/YloC family endoribonuclease [unclassified Alistipes]